MAIIITYDVPSKHTELKKSLLQLGYKDQIPDKSGKCKNGIIYCPNTTLYHPSKKPSQARDEVTVACEGLGIEPERCVSTPWGSGWAAVCGEPFK